MEKETLPEIFWTKSASRSFRKAKKYIEEDTPKATLQFQKQIDSAIQSIPANPLKYPPDRFRAHNMGNSVPSN